MVEKMAEYGWHLDRRVPLTMITLFFAQTITLVYVGSAWKADTDSRIARLERENEERKPQESRLIKLEERLSYMSESQRRVETKLDLLVQSINGASRPQ
jgi:hypothetical protein